MGISLCTQIDFYEGGKVLTSLLYKFRARFMQLFLHRISLCVLNLLKHLIVTSYLRFKKSQFFLCNERDNELTSLAIISNKLFTFG